MDIPYKKRPAEIDFIPFMRLLCEEKGYDYRDWLGKFKNRICNIGGKHGIDQWGQGDAPDP